MIVPATVPLLAPVMPNGQTPISATQIQQSQAYLFRINTAADNAKAAVLGSCQVPVSLTDTSMASSSSPILAWIQANPALALAIGVGVVLLLTSRGRR